MADVNRAHQGSTDEAAIEFIFQHGWAFASAHWKQWQDILLQTLPYPIRFINLDRGYFKSPTISQSHEPIAATATGAVRIVIVHSLGLHLLPERFLQADALICIGSFIHFHPEQPLQKRLSVKTIDRMIRKLDSCPEEVLNDFHQACGLSLDSIPEFNIATLNVELLRQDLQFLSSSRLDLNLSGLGPQTEDGSIPHASARQRLIVHGENDTIVSKEKARELACALRNAQLVLLPEPGHGLPFTHADLCIKTILERVSIPDLCSTFSESGQPALSTIFSNPA